MNFLPINKQEIMDRGWSHLDFIMVTGDAYVDHPSFGAAIITRTLERYGYRVGIIAQPDWRSLESFKILGKPRIAFLINSGNIDSMVNHYSVFKKRRKTDVYSPGGKTNLRPDRAVVVYGNRVREAYKDCSIIIGGIEASLRRFGHYDYWDNRVRQSVLMDSAADLLVYGMAEKTIIEIAEALDSGIPISELSYIRGTVFKTKDETRVYDAIELPSFSEIVESKDRYAKSFRIQYENTDAIQGKQLVEKYGNILIVQNPPAYPLTQQEMDDVYQYNYMRRSHPIYDDKGGVPAFQEVQFSITANRGCYGGCSFCALTFHQGRVIQSRSKDSLIEEGKILIEDPSFKGYIHDVGGPTANFMNKACEKQVKHGVCQDRQCIFPEKCKQLIVDHEFYLECLQALRALKGVKKVFIRSGIRYDYVMYDKKDDFLKTLCQHHVSGQLRVAPEHVSEKVLALMGKPSHLVYKQFVDKFDAISNKMGKDQYIVPYFISSHPGSTLEDAIMLAEYIRDTGHIPEQVQDFYPTPGTLSTCMYYTGLNPITMESVYIPNSLEEKRMQRALIQYNKKENYKLVKKALEKAGRKDLIGKGKKALIQ